MKPKQAIVLGLLCITAFALSSVMACFAWSFALWPLNDSYAFSLSSPGWLMVAVKQCLGMLVPGLILTALVYFCIRSLVPSPRWRPLLITAACCGIYPITVVAASVVFYIKRPYL